MAFEVRRLLGVGPFSLDELWAFAPPMTGGIQTRSSCPKKRLLSALDLYFLQQTAGVAVEDRLFCLICHKQIIQSTSIMSVNRREFDLILQSSVLLELPVASSGRSVGSSSSEKHGSDRARQHIGELRQKMERIEEDHQPTLDQADSDIILPADSISSDESELSALRHEQMELLWKSSAPDDDGSSCVSQGQLLFPLYQFASMFVLDSFQAVDEVVRVMHVLINASATEIDHQLFDRLLEKTVARQDGEGGGLKRRGSKRRTEAADDDDDEDSDEYRYEDDDDDEDRAFASYERQSTDFLRASMPSMLLESVDLSEAGAPAEARQASAMFSDADGSIAEEEHHHQQPVGVVDQAEAVAQIEGELGLGFEEEDESGKNPVAECCSRTGDFIVKHKWKFVIAFIIIAILVVILVPSSFHRLEATQIGIAYDTATCKLGNETLWEGRYTLGPSGKILKFSATQITENDRSNNVFSRDGIILDVLYQVAFTITPKELREVVDEWADEENLIDYVRAVARTAVAEVALEFDSRDMYMSRHSFQEALQGAVALAFEAAETHCELQTLELTNVDLPSSADRALLATTTAIQDVQNAAYERAREVLEAEIRVNVTEAEVNILFLEAERERDEIILRSDEEVQIERQRVSRYSYAFGNITAAMGVSGDFFVSSYLAALVLKEHRHGELVADIGPTPPFEAVP